MKRHILFVGTWPPAPGFGSPGPIYQHLKRLRDTKISIITKRNIEKTNLPDSWRVIAEDSIGKRPPGFYNLPQYYEKKIDFLRKSYEPFFKNEKPACVINHFGTNSMLAYHLSRAWRIPLFVFLYDPWDIWPQPLWERYQMKRKKARDILNHASAIWSVSDELATFCGMKNSGKVRVIKPIPEANTEGYAEWNKSFNASPVMAYAGSFHFHEIRYFRIIANLLREFRGRLVLITTRNKVVKMLMKGISNVQLEKPFSDTKELFRFLKKTVSSVIVPVSFGKNHWRGLSFPSKFSQFVHLGLPVFIISPEGAAISGWAKRNKWRGYSNSLDKGDISPLIRRSMAEDTWLEMAAQSREAAENEFNPEKIQAEFEATLNL